MIIQATSNSNDKFWQRVSTRARGTIFMADARERFEVAADAVPLTSRGYALYAGVETPPRFKLVAGGLLQCRRAMTSATLCCDPVVGTAGTTFEAAAL